METVVPTLVATVLVGGLALLAQWGRKNRRAAVSLVVVLLALSLLVAGVGLLTGVGLFLAAGREGTSAGDQLAFGAVGVSAIVAGAAGLALCVPPLRKIAGARLRNDFWADPPVFLALWLTVVVLANNAASFLIFTQEPDVASLFPTGRISPAQILTSQLPFVVVAFLGVGLGVRRSFREALARLGYGRITAGQLGLVALFIMGAYALSLVANALFFALQPDLARTVGDLSRSLFDPSGLSVIAAVSFALLIGVGAALGEETLFRGAVQPVLGIPLTSVLFASMHIQYGPSIVLGYVFLLSIGLGYLRRHVNTTASFLAHAGYNTIGILLAYFLGL